MDETILGRMDGAYVTYVTNVVKQQWRTVTLVWPFKAH